MRAVLVACILVVSLGTGHANGRDPATSTINFQRGNDQHIYAGMTFGLVRSLDGGATWQWMCERAVGYGGQYDPDYVMPNPTSCCGVGDGRGSALLALPVALCLRRGTRRSRTAIRR